MGKLGPEVAVQRGLDVAALPDFREHLFEQGRALFPLMGPGGVEVIQKFQAFGLFL